MLIEFWTVNRCCCDFTFAKPMPSQVEGKRNVIVFRTPGALMGSNVGEIDGWAAGTTKTFHSLGYF